MNYGPFTIAIVLITVLISIPAMNDERLVNKLILWPKKMTSPGEYYRLLTSGFIHADWGHLFFNMFTMFFIGTSVEYVFSIIGTPWLYVLLYLSGIIAASIPSFIKHRNNAYYRALGASGGVSAVLFSYVYFAPWEKIYIYFIKVPSIIFAVIYLGYSAYMSRKGTDNIGHDAHFYGAVYGLIFTFLVDPSHGQNFLYQITHPSF
jgi:membrane associated rhomboid family serine protease